MNNKDLDAFNEWRNSTSTRLDIHDAWQAALEYERFNHKYCVVGFLDKLQAENKKLREALEYIQSNTESSYIFNWAEEALKKE
jgi:hypothetical protein